MKIKIIKFLLWKKVNLSQQKESESKCLHFFLRKRKEKRRESLFENIDL